MKSALIFSVAVTAVCVDYDIVFCVSDTQAIHKQ